MTDGPSPAGAGPIALVGSGEFLPAMEAVDAALLAGRPARAVFLPTAAGEEGPERVAYWLRLGTDHYRRLGAEPVPLAVLDRRDADDEKLAAQVAGAGLIYLSGGNPGYLADTLRGTAVLDAILAAWRNGAALAGCSAGACALTAVADDTRTGAPRPGLAVVPGLVVLPHFDRIEQWRPGIVAARATGIGPGQTLVGIDEETALISDNAGLISDNAGLISHDAGGWTVEGCGQVWLLAPDGRRTGHAAGARVAFAPRAGK
ncbi:MAG: cyanophycinase [Actinomycetota bacterium]|nr:cyanophycinase [Actinomycetota bacterium]